MKIVIHPTKNSKDTLLLVMKKGVDVRNVRQLLNKNIDSAIPVILEMAKRVLTIPRRDRRKAELVSAFIVDAGCVIENLWPETQE